MDVGTSSSSSLRKVPFFFLLASEPGDFGREKWHSQTELDHRLAICQAGLKQIPLCHEGERKTYSFSSGIQWIKQNPTPPFLLFANVATDVNKAPAGSLMTNSILVNFAIFGKLKNMIVCCTLRRNHISLLEMTACSHSQPMLFMWHSCYLASSQREWLNGFMDFFFSRNHTVCQTI